MPIIWYNIVGGVNMKHKLLNEINGYENCSKYKIYENGDIYNKKGKKLKLSVDTKGYKYLDIRQQNGKNKCPKIHRLIAEAFLENLENKPQINHIDGNKLNNSIENLEWCTQEENRKHAIKLGLKDEINYYIVQLSLNNEYIATFRTATEALKSLGKKHSGGNIGRVIRGNRKTAYGYKWISLEEYEGSTTIQKWSTLK